MGITPTNRDLEPLEGLYALWTVSVYERYQRNEVTFDDAYFPLLIL